MASKGVLLLGNTDSLDVVIKKCNTNFQAILTQQSQSETIAKQSQESAAEQIVEEVMDAIGDAVGDLVQQIEDEADTRSRADEDLEDAIETVDNKFDDYTKTSDMAAVATSGDYDDLTNKPTASDYLTYSHDDILWKIENNTVGEVMKKTDVTGYTDLVVRCVGEDGNPCYTPLVLIPKDSYQNYTANGKTFKMEINTSDNNRLWWVVPTGTWELWMR